MFTSCRLEVYSYEGVKLTHGRPKTKFLFLPCPQIRRVQRKSYLRLTVNAHIRSQSGRPPLMWWLQMNEL